MPTACLCAFCCRRARPATSRMLRHSWIRFASLVARPTSQALPLVAGRQGLRCRALVPVLRPLPDAACDSAANHETQAQARPTKSVRPPEIPAAQYHRADVRLAEGEPQDWHSLRQAGKKFCRHGHAGLHTAVPTAVLFVQNLAKGCCVLTGTAFDLPMILKVDPLLEGHRPASDDVNLDALWETP